MFLSTFYKTLLIAGALIYPSCAMEETTDSPFSTGIAKPDKAYTIEFDDLWLYLTRQQLSPQEKEQTLLAYKKFALKCKTMFAETSEASKCHMPEWGIWATILFKSVVNTPKVIHGAAHHAMIQMFKDELNERISNKDTSYLWFVLYCDRLTSLTSTICEILNFSFFNTNFGKYKYDALYGKEKDALNFMTHDDMEKSYKTLGNAYTRHLYSPLSLIKQFPEIVMLPFPWPLDDWEIAQNMIHGQKNLWLLGFALDKITFDGVVDQSPSLFISHDMAHLSQLRAEEKELTFLLETRDQIEELIKPENLNLLYAYQKERTDFYQQLCNDILELIDKKVIDPDEKKIFKFFMFYQVHELISSIINRLNMILRPQGGICQNAALHDKNYYLPLLPPSLQNSSFQFFRSLQTRYYENKFGNFLKSNIPPLIYDELSKKIKYVNGINNICLSPLFKAQEMTNPLFVTFDVTPHQTETYKLELLSPVDLLNPDFYINQKKSIVKIYFPGNSAQHYQLFVIPTPKDKSYFEALQCILGPLDSSPYKA